MTVEMWDMYPGVFDNWVLNNVDGVDPSSDIEKIVKTPAGSLDPHFKSTAETRPNVKFDSSDVQTILSQIPLMNGLAVTQHGKIQYVRRVDGGAYVSGNSHLALSTTKGFIYVEELSAEQSSKDGAKVSLMYQVLFDGNNMPVNVLTGQALVGSPAVNAVHGLGPTKFEGAFIDGFTNMSFKTGIQFERAPADGVLCSTVGTINERDPMLTLTGRNVSLAAHNKLRFDTSMPLDQPLTCYLTKRIPGGQVFNYNFNVHISIMITAGTYTLTKISGGQKQRANLELTVEPTANAISINTATSVS